MAEKISQYTADGISNPIKGADLLDFSNEDGGGGFDVSKKITVTELMTYINSNVDNLYNNNGILQSERTILSPNLGITLDAGDITIEMNDEATDHAFLLKNSGSLEWGRFGIDQNTASGMLEISDGGGTWFSANDGQVSIGGVNPVGILDIETPNGSDLPLGIYENRVGGASIGDGNSINFYYNDDLGVRTLGGLISTRIDAAPTTGDVNMSMTLNNLIKIQPTERILITPSASVGAAVAFCEIRGDATTPNETLLVKSGSNGTGSALLIRNLAGQNLFSFKSNGDFDLNQSNLSTGDFAWRGQTNNNAVFFDASNDNVGFGTNTPNSSAIVEFSSTTKGVRYTPMTVSQAGAITVQEGLVLFVSDTDGTFPTIGLYCYENGAWNKL